MTTVIQVLWPSFQLVVRLVAAALLVSTAVKAVEHGGAWYALAALCVVGAVFAVLMTGIYVWMALGSLRGKPLDLEQPVPLRRGVDSP